MAEETERREKCRNPEKKKKGKSKLRLMLLIIHTLPYSVCWRRLLHFGDRIPERQLHPAYNMLQRRRRSMRVGPIIGS